MPGPSCGCYTARCCEGGSFPLKRQAVRFVKLGSYSYYVPDSGGVEQVRCRRRRRCRAPLDRACYVCCCAKRCQRQQEAPPQSRTAEHPARGLWQKTFLEKAQAKDQAPQLGWVGWPGGSWTGRLERGFAIMAELNMARCVMMS